MSFLSVRKKKTLSSRHVGFYSLFAKVIIFVLFVSFISMLVSTLPIIMTIEMLFGTFD